MKKFSKLKFIEKLTEIPQRQSEGEEIAINEIKKILRANGIEFEIESYENCIPVEISSGLKVDNVEINCENSGFISGSIDNKHNLVSSLSDFESSSPNINFNPYCKDISLVSFYNAPSLAISSMDVCRVLNAEKIEGFTKVEKKFCKSANFLVGNKKAPKNIFFTHIDSIKKGAIDNASGVAVILDAIISNPKIIKDNLFAICGSEELSYEYPVYWGFGYRDFEKKYLNLLKKVKKIVVVDGVGHSEPNLYKNKELLFQAFPIKNLNEFENKTVVLAGDIDGLMPVYHSDLDDISRLKGEFLSKAQKIVVDFSNE